MTIQELFLEKDYNCAETVLLWANERYGLRVAPEDVALVSGFGGGLGCGETCGARPWSGSGPTPPRPFGRPALSWWTGFGRTWAASNAPS